MKQKVVQSITEPNFTSFGKVVAGQVFRLADRPGYWMRVGNSDGSAASQALNLESGQLGAFEEDHLVALPAGAHFQISW